MKGDDVILIMPCKAQDTSCRDAEREVYTTFPPASLDTEWPRRKLRLYTPTYIQSISACNVCTGQHTCTQTTRMHTYANDIYTHKLKACAR
jgi:hypothetical protein